MVGRRWYWRWDFGSFGRDFTDFAMVALTWDLIIKMIMKCFSGYLL